MEIYSDKSLFCFRKQKIWNKQSDLTPKRIENKELTKSKVTRRKEIKDTRTEINRDKKGVRGSEGKVQSSWELVFGKDTQNRWLSSQTHQERQRGLKTLNQNEKWDITPDTTVGP